MEELPGPRQASCNWGKDTDRWNWVWLSVRTVLIAYISTQTSLLPASILLLFNTECQFSMPTCFSSVIGLSHFFLLLTLSFFIFFSQSRLNWFAGSLLPSVLREETVLYCVSVYIFTCLFSLTSAKIPFPNPYVPTVPNLPNTNLSLSHRLLPPPPFWGRVSLCIFVLELTL